MKDKNINKATRYIIFRDREVTINTILFSLLALAYLLSLYKFLLSVKGENFVILMTYALILGIGVIASNTITINLSVKEKLTGRLEFLLATGFEIKEIIKVYTLENWRISSIASYIIFFGTLMICDLGKIFIFAYLSTISLHYCVVLTFNILAMYRKNFKFFKNIIFFSTSLLIYLFGVFSEKILVFLERLNLDVNIFIININLFATILLLAYSFFELRKMNNESVMEVKSEWY